MLSFARNILAFLSFQIEQMLANHNKCIKEHLELTKPEEIQN